MNPDSDLASPSIQVSTQTPTQAPIQAPTQAELQTVAATCTCFNLRKATRLVTQRFEEVLKPTGLVGTQFTLLAAIASVGSGTISDLAAGLVLDRTTLTRSLKPLERQGWVRIEPGQDQRERVVSLTPAGQQQLAQAMPFWRQAQAQVIDALGPQDWERLLAELTKTISGLQGQ